MPITSKQNELVKKIRKLSDRKWRQQYGEYIAEGKRWVNDALSVCPENVAAVICAENAPFEKADVVLDTQLFASLSDTENSQGVMAILRMPPPAVDFAGRYCLFLDRVRDPGNMGAIIRTSCAAGYRDIVLNDCVDVYNPKVIRSSMTGILSVRFHYAQDLQKVKAAGFTVVAAALGGADVFAEPFTAQKICLVIGNEADGIGEDLRKECERTVTIPMESDIESLNAAVSAGILMYTIKYGKE